MKRISSVLMFFVVVFNLSIGGFYGSYADAGFKISGYIAPNFPYTEEVAPILESGFKVEIVGTQYSATTSEKGYFEVNGVPENDIGYTIKITKRTYLYREIKNVVLKSDIMLGTENEPVIMWAGDIPYNNVQDDIISALDGIYMNVLLNPERKDDETKEMRANLNIEDGDINKDGRISFNDLMPISLHFETGLPSNYDKFNPVKITKISPDISEMPTSVTLHTSVTTSTPTSVLIVESTPTATSTSMATSTPTATSTPMATSTSTATPTPTPAKFETIPTPTGLSDVTLPLNSPVPGSNLEVISKEETYNVVVPRIEDFTDVSGHWASKYIQYLLEKRILEGYNNKTIRPNNSITRVEAVALLCRALSSKTPEKVELKFSDNKQIPAWGLDYVKSAVYSEIINGYPDNTFKPFKKINRAETLTFITGAFALGGTIKNTHKYEDQNKIPSWAEHPVAEAYELGIAKGYGDNTFRPGNDITRAEYFAMIYNAIHITGKTDLRISK